MRIGIDYGRQRLELDVDKLVNVHRAPLAPALADVPAAVRDALENPFHYPALRRALTPDDHLALVIDESLPRLERFLIPILEHLVQAQIAPEAITIVCPNESSQPWVDELPDQFEEVKIEVHDPSERKKLAYLATTKQGRRIYINRTTVDADQIVVLCRRGYDPVLGYSGGEGSLYPALSDQATRQELAGKLSLAVPTDLPWPVRQEAEEVAWLLGAPFLVQVIEGAGDDIIHVLGGSLESNMECRRLLDARWRLEIDQPAQMVIASVTGDPAHHDFAVLAQALASAARAAEPGGKIVLLTTAKPELGPGAEIIRQAESPADALDLFKKEAPADLAAAVQWASAVQKNKVYLLSGLDLEIAEELFATPLDKAEQAQKLLNDGGRCLILPDTHKTMVVVRSK